MRTTSTIILASLLIAASAPAIAQAPPAPATPPQATAPPSPQRAAGCAPSDRLATNPDGTTTGQSREPLGEKLAKTDGVLCPPAGIDPDMHAPTPNTGANTPVIPPPGSPGGDPNVRPK